MRERLSALNPDAAIEMWVGTFHAFGLELVTKWPSSVGRTINVRVLDQAGSLALLEANLGEAAAAALPKPLRSRLRSGQRPARHLALQGRTDPPVTLLGRGGSGAGRGSDRRTALGAEKALEVARIYQIYEDELRRGDAVDFGDLVLLAVKLVEENPAVQKHVAGFRHVLVDEYQDVNLASARLLRLVCDAGARRLGRCRRAPVHLPLSGCRAHERLALRRRVLRRERIRSRTTTDPSRRSCARSKRFRRAWARRGRWQATG